MKKILLITLAVILVLAGIILFSYPFISNYLMTIRTDSAVVQYLDTTVEYPDEWYKKLRKKAVEYNKTLLNTVVTEEQYVIDSQREDVRKILEIDDSQIISVIDIPKIDTRLPVYYGTSEEVLSEGIGILENSSLPVGGIGTHAVFTGHTGYGGLNLFSDLEVLEIGDIFYVMTLGDTMAYEVDNIQVVLPEETDLLQIDSQQDYVTLVTCTPFGINSHRLLVRGKRVNEKDIPTEKLAEKAESKWMQEYSKALMFGIGIMLSILFMFIIIRLIIFFVRKRKKDEKKDC